MSWADALGRSLRLISTLEAGCVQRGNSIDCAHRTRPQALDQRASETQEQVNHQGQGNDTELGR